MQKYRNFALVAVLMTAVTLNADTFKNRQTGEVFHGFATQKSSKNQTLVFIKEQNTLKPLSISDYEITPNAEGRRDSVIIVPVKAQEAMISKTVAETIAETIIKSADSGPMFIIIDIDSPGGNGEYMKIICNAITQTRNCTLVAYISGKKFGGGFAAAAALALACDKIYIAPTASIGALPPVTGRAMSDDEIAAYYETFSGKALASYKTYIAALAEAKNRPAALAMALLDTNVEIVEVADEKGNKSLISKADRQTNQTVIRTIGAPGPTVATKKDTGSTKTGNALNLSANDAIQTRIADQIAASVKDILGDMGSQDAKVATSGAIDDAINRFVAAKRNLDRSLANINVLQDRADNLEKQIQGFEEQNQKNTVTRRYTQSDRSDYRTGRDLTDRGYDPSQEQNTLRTTGRRQQTNPRNQNRTETVTVSEPAIAANVLYQEMVGVLSNLIVEYRKAVGLAQRWPGALPQDLTVELLQSRLNTAIAMNDSIRFRRATP